MKLRNKKTGEIFEIELIYKSCNLRLPFKTDYGKDVTLSHLNENFEDAKEPLIKDEKVRKAVKAWAEADGADEKIYLTIDENGSRFANKYGGYIEFAFQIDMDERLYTIAELCGSEE